MKPPTIRSLICEGLGYCCPALFFHLYPSSSLVARRLGVTVRAVNYAKKSAAVEGCAEGCPGYGRCQKLKLARLRPTQGEEQKPADHTPPPPPREPR